MQFIVMAPSRRRPALECDVIARLDPKSFFSREKCDHERQKSSICRIGTRSSKCPKNSADSV